MHALPFQHSVSKIKVFDKFDYLTQKNNHLSYNISRKISIVRGDITSIAVLQNPHGFIETLLLSVAKQLIG